MSHVEAVAAAAAAEATMAASDSAPAEHPPTTVPAAVAHTWPWYTPTAAKAALTSACAAGLKLITGGDNAAAAAPNDC